MATERVPRQRLPPSAWAALMEEDAKRVASGIQPVAKGVSTGTVVKLLAFTLAMVTLPLGSYFYSRDRWFGGQSFYSAILAAFIANVVLIAYILVAVEEDRGEQQAAEAGAKLIEGESKGEGEQVEELKKEK